MSQPCDSRETSSASDMEEISKVPSLQDGSTSVTDDEGWNSSRSRCRRPKWTREEEMVLVEAHATLGNAWVAIAECLPQRSSAEVKNIWHSTLRARKLQTRSVLRAYVTALKDRADKPAARQQALRAAQQFLSEGSGKACSPAKRVTRRPPEQQRVQPQHPHQQRLPDLRTTGTRASPPPPLPPQRPVSATAAADASGGHWKQEAAAAVVMAVGPHRGGGVASSTGLAAVTAPVSVAGPATGHRSSLGSEWSCVSSGALESWPPVAVGGGSDDVSKALTPPPVISFSPLVNGGGAPAATAGQRASTSLTVCRSRSPALCPGSPPLSHPPTGARDCGRTEWRADWVSSARDAARLAAAQQQQQQQQQQPSMTWLAPAGPAASALTSSQRGATSWRSAGRASESATQPSAAWGPVTLAPEAASVRRGYVVSTGGGGGSGADGCGLWADVGRAAMTGLPCANFSMSATAASLSASLTHAHAGHASSAKPFPAAQGARSAASVAAQLRATVPAVQSSFSSTGYAMADGGGAGAGSSVVTMGLYGITDEELLACLRA